MLNIGNRQRKYHIHKHHNCYGINLLSFLHYFYYFLDTMISNYIINATLKKNTISVQNAIHLLNHSGGLQLRSNITNKVKNSNDKKWFSNIDTICRGRSRAGGNRGNPGDRK